jgi:hypothetical protein
VYRSSYLFVCQFIILFACRASRDFVLRDTARVRIWDRDLYGLCCSYLNVRVPICTYSGVFSQDWGLVRAAHTLRVPGELKHYTELCCIVLSSIPSCSHRCLPFSAFPSIFASLLFLCFSIFPSTSPSITLILPLSPLSLSPLSLLLPAGIPLVDNTSAPSILFPPSDCEEVFSAVHAPGTGDRYQEDYHR